MGGSRFIRYEFEQKLEELLQNFDQWLKFKTMASKIFKPAGQR
jgi:hypothetical protein